MVSAQGADCWGTLGNQEAARPSTPGTWLGAGQPSSGLQGAESLGELASWKLRAVESDN